MVLKREESLNNLSNSTLKGYIGNILSCSIYWIPPLIKEGAFLLVQRRDMDIKYQQIKITKYLNVFLMISVL